MPELKVSRSYHDALRRIGVQNPGEVGVQVPVMLTAQVDDFSALVPPVTSTIAAGRMTSAAQAATFSIIELIVQPPCRGAFVTGVVNNTGGNLLMNIVDSAPTGAITASAFLTFFTGPGPQRSNATQPACELVAAHNTTLPAANGSLEALASGIFLPLDVFLEPGQRFRIARSTQNTVVTATIFWREVPGRPEADVSS